jgi:nitrite reductase/ring-hydroxylating ferredoxin subunit
VPEILVCKVDDLNDGESMRVELDPDDIAIFRVDGQFYATADLCTMRIGRSARNVNSSAMRSSVASIRGDSMSGPARRPTNLVEPMH